MRFRTRALAACAVAFALVAAGCGGDDDDDGGAAGTEAGGTTGAATEGTSGAATEGTGGAATEGTGAGTSGAATACTAERGDTLTVAAIGYPVQGLEANVAEVANRGMYFQAVYDSLLRAEPDGTIVPWLATEWEYNDDNTVLTLKLRDDVTFTDGTPFNADAAAQNLIRFRDGTAPGAGFLALLADAKAVDDTTLEITLSGPDPAFLNYLTRDPGMVQSPASFDTGDPIGSGPYIYNAGDSVTESVYTYDANPDYWAPEMVKYDKLVVRYLQDATATLNAIKAGEVNAANLISSNMIPDVEGAGWDLHTQELDWVGLTLVDRDGAMGTPLGDVKVRQAINQAFDREALLQGLEAGYGSVTTQVFREDSAGFDPALDELYPYDPDAAKQLLADAGYPDGFDLSLPTATALGEQFFATIQDQLGAIGIDVSYTDEGSDYFGAILAPKYPAYLMFLEQALNDWQFVSFLLSETATWNPAHYSDATSEELISTIQNTEGEEQAAATKELGKYVTEQAWFAPWYRKQATFATDATVDAVVQTGNAVPYIFNYCPQS